MQHTLKKIGLKIGEMKYLCCIIYDAMYNPEFGWVITASSPFGGRGESHLNISRQLTSRILYKLVARVPDT